MHGTRVIVADATKISRGIYHHWDLVTQLSREQLEINQISKRQKCLSHCEEQSINRVFHSSMHGSRAMLAVATKISRRIYHRWYLVTQLS